MIGALTYTSSHWLVERKQNVQQTVPRICRKTRQPTSSLTLHEQAWKDKFQKSCTEDEVEFRVFIHANFVRSADNAIRRGAKWLNKILTEQNDFSENYHFLGSFHSHKNEKSFQFHDCGLSKQFHEASKKPIAVWFWT